MPFEQYHFNEWEKENEAMIDEREEVMEKIKKNMNLWKDEEDGGNKKKKENTRELVGENK